MWNSPFPRTMPDRRFGTRGPVTFVWVSPPPQTHSSYYLGRKLGLQEDRVLRQRGKAQAQAPKISTPDKVGSCPLYLRKRQRQTLTQCESDALRLAAGSPSILKTSQVCAGPRCMHLSTSAKTCLRLARDPTSLDCKMLLFPFFFWSLLSMSQQVETCNTGR